MINNFHSNYTKIDCQNVLDAYKHGLFPMSEDHNSPDIFWVKPKIRGIIDPYKVTLRKKLKRLLNKNPYTIKINTDFIGVIEGCAETTKIRDNTWINPSIRDVYIELHYKGYAHSIECYLNKELVGGLYGVAMGGVFFGESMFSKSPNASKIALVHLIERLKIGKFTILDTQFITDHLKTFGAYEINQDKFLDILKTALLIEANFFSIGPSGDLNIKLYPKSYNY
ncbi:leucyl/phenylalanyl-tRNA--protein transferase [Alphaproteobacteria bacterium]|nr:leucyl/phenylalanyl-tRNA--protein transferase [Alphaproteobacteria bacterium]